MNTFWRVILLNGQAIEAGSAKVDEDNKQWILEDNVIVIPMKQGIEPLKPKQAVFPISSVLYMVEIEEVK